jgi:hypothetical protein
MQLQRVCHDTLPWLISVSLGLMKALVLTIVSILIAFAASVANIQWLAVIAVLGAIAGAYWQYKDGQPFELRFEETAWLKNGSMFELSVPKRRHGKTRPTITIFEATSDAFQEVSCDTATDEDDRIVVSSSKPFSGSLIVK